MCVTHWQALWRVRLRPGSDDSSKLSACLWARGIFVLILVLLLFQMQASNLGLVVHRVLEMFAFACVDGFYSCLEQIEKKKTLCQEHKGNPIICIPIVILLCLQHPTKAPSG